MYWRRLLPAERYTTLSKFVFGWAEASCPKCSIAAKRDWPKLFRRASRDWLRGRVKLLPKFVIGSASEARYRILDWRTIFVLHLWFLVSGVCPYNFALRHVWLRCLLLWLWRSPQTNKQQVSECWCIASYRTHSIDLHACYTVLHCTIVSCTPVPIDSTLHALMHSRPAYMLV
jgi:hypothetical protein